VEGLQYVVETALRRPVPGEQVYEEVAEGEACEGKYEEEGRCLKGVGVEGLPRVDDEVVDGRGYQTRRPADQYGEKPPGEAYPLQSQPNPY
jgi:hypothetical protein